ncbi:hypothetical protein L914_09806 [Phytophthora nicotianae]|uniref:Uncharacterized protein n=1 Tax=Phytophthora nicotianae TaxID=4792 RepID=W2N8L5_PHYNI|nr:hypothetical protein L914_09806 [Phytophthora nicotianae]
MDASLNSGCGGRTCNAVGQFQSGVRCLAVVTLDGESEVIAERRPRVQGLGDGWLYASEGQPWSRSERLCHEGEARQKQVVSGRKTDQNEREALKRSAISEY